MGKHYTATYHRNGGFGTTTDFVEFVVHANAIIKLHSLEIFHSAGLRGSANEDYPNADLTIEKGFTTPGSGSASGNYEIKPVSAGSGALLSTVGGLHTVLASGGSPVVLRRFRWNRRASMFRCFLSPIIFKGGEIANIQQNFGNQSPGTATCVIHFEEVGG